MAHLQSVNQTTTFFVLGVQIALFPDVLRAAHKQGHLIASHTWGHKYLPSLTNEEVAAQLMWSIWIMNTTLGVIPKFYRPPFGGVDNRIRAISARLGLTVVVWNLDSNDWRLNDGSRTEQEIYDQIRGWKRSEVTGIILEHDASTITVRAGQEISKIIGNYQGSISNCSGGNLSWYQ